MKNFLSSYRPLAGMSCIFCAALVVAGYKKLPSPRGDELHQLNKRISKMLEGVTDPLRGEMHPFGSFFSSRYNNVTVPLRG